MSATTRYNGDYGNFTEGTLYTVAQLKAVLVTVLDDSSTAVSLAAEDTDGAGEVDQLVPLLVKEFQPLMYIVKGASHNELHMIVDGHAVDATSMQARARVVVSDYKGYTVANNDTTVAIGTAITVS
jgi:hypothetical protein